MKAKVFQLLSNKEADRTFSIHFLIICLLRDESESVPSAIE